MVSRVGIAAAAMCAAGGMAMLWDGANTPPLPGHENADITWSDPAPRVTPQPDSPAPSRHETPTPSSVEVAPTYPAGEGSPRTAWAACVVHALTTPGMGGDADMTDCDDAYYWATGQPATLWLWCPGAPEQGGCRAEDGPYPTPRSEEVVEAPEYAPGEEPQTFPPLPEVTAEPTPTVTPDTTPVS